jgi:hypothetical protein
VLWRRLELPGHVEHLRYLRNRADAREQQGHDSSATKLSRPAIVQNQLIRTLKPS